MRLNLDFLYRRKKYDAATLESTNLDRVLNVFDLTALGVSCTLGSGVYVLIGNIMSNYAGPSIILSFVVALVCSFLAGLCYAELGARVPRSGSAYVYLYVTIGEFLAFIIGWNVILEYVIGTSTTASALSRYIDSLTGDQISQAFRNAMPMNASMFGPYPDFLAFGFVLVVTSFLIIGVRESSFMNVIFTSINISVILFIIVAGAAMADPKNWDLHVYPSMNYTDISGQNLTCASSGKCGDGGFMPFGIQGVLKGAAKCFYAYIGFDVIATTGEEVINPKKTIPLSIISTLIVVSLCYVGVSFVISLMIPYYVFDMDAPLSEAFRYVGLDWASYVVSVGAIISLATCLFASMFPMPRVVYSMANDGLLFQWLAYLAPRLKTPVLASLVTGLLAGFLVLIFDLNQLIDMMSIGTLLAYSLVSTCTLVLRYIPSTTSSTSIEPSTTTETPANAPAEPATTQLTNDRLVDKILNYIFGKSNESLFYRLFWPASTKSNLATSHLVNTITVIAVINILILCCLLNQSTINAASYVFIIIFLVIICLLTFIIWMQPQNDEITTFKVPLVPFFPILSTFVNIFLMVSLNSATWIRFGIWMFVGFLVYFGYGIRNSKENIKGSHQNRFLPCIEKSYGTMTDENENESDL